MDPARSVLLTGTTYHPFGAPAQWAYGNGRVMTRDVDLNYLPSRIRSGSASAFDYAYGFNAVGNLTQLKDGSTNAVLRNYGYDGLGRLTSDTVGATSGYPREYRYDKTGNRTAATRLVATSGGGGPGGGSNTYQPQWFDYAYAAGSHRLVSDGAEPRENDAAGNLVKIGSDSAPGGARKVFSYNEDNRLSAVSRLGATLATYAYNAAGQRVRRIASGIETISLYDESGQWLGDYNSYGAAEQQVIWLGNLPVGVIVGNGAAAKLYYVEADALGTPRSVVDPVRNVAVWRWGLEGEAFGSDYPNEDADGDGAVFNFDMRFPGQRFDAASGLNYNYFRDYDAAIGRYVESDPIGLEGGLSTFGYVDGSPLIYSDVFGLANSGQTVRIPGGNPTTVRIDQPHDGQPGQQRHAHVCERGCKEIVVNEDGSGSHNKDPSKLKRRVIEYLRKKGFTLSCPPLFDRVLIEILRTECERGNPVACKLFKDLGGKIVGDPNEIVLKSDQTNLPTLQSPAPEHRNEDDDDIVKLAA